MAVGIKDSKFIVEFIEAMRNYLFYAALFDEDGSVVGNVLIVADNWDMADEKAREYWKCSDHDPLLVGVSSIVQTADGVFHLRGEAGGDLIKSGWRIIDEF